MIKESKKFSSKELLLASIVLITVVGSLGLAIIDPTARPAFEDLAKIALGAYFGRFLK